MGEGLDESGFCAVLAKSSDKDSSLENFVIV
eukprot:CAMPEP_0194186038 /NCGR_PEP_ID=MMETSP0154-20130528/45299_1 /TAXON_ID=1049557 /ORGANISM="Thalassiothrix antarctica, Strain L6-D1" /LENGTH=30 /DNA_ID= /DNA_START= /DNA_END= /DNA_ORIENTATION=